MQPSPSSVDLRKLVVGGTTCLLIAAILAIVISRGQFGLRDAGKFHSEVVSASSARDDIDVKVASDALVRSIIIEWNKRNPKP